MRKVTKRPKKVDVRFTKTTSYYSEYTCPTCGITYTGGGPNKKTTRFICDCGQELIVEQEAENE